MGRKCFVGWVVEEERFFKSTTHGGQGMFEIEGAALMIQGGSL